MREQLHLAGRLFHSWFPFKRGAILRVAFATRLDPRQRWRRLAVHCLTTDRTRKPATTPSKPARVCS